MPIQSIRLNMEVDALLTEAKLPVSDLSNSPSLNLLGVHECGRLIGVVGIEVYGEVGLLRSLAVALDRRNTGLGPRLVSNAEALAVERGIKTLYLLTTTAIDFFARLGYEKIERLEAPTAILETAQCAHLCPTSSALMRKALSG